MTLSSKKVWGFAWAGWALMTGVSFVWLESCALKKRYHPTLSTTLRRVLGIYPKTPWGRLALAGFASFWMWLVAHIAHVPDDVWYGPEPPEGSWFEIAPAMWYREPRRHSLI